MTGPKRPAGRQLAWANRKVLAERLGWPAGMLEACEQLDREHPDWTAFWRSEVTWAQHPHPAGFVATREGDGLHVCGVDVAAVTEAIESAPDQGVVGQLYTPFCCELGCWRGNWAERIPWYNRL